jgi:Putative prokaryotic signal transducing protein
MGEPLVLVYTAASPIEGQIVKGRLEVEGIPVLIKGEGEGPYRMGPAELYVPANLEPHARAVLDAVDADDAGSHAEPSGDRDSGSDGRGSDRRDDASR